MLLRLEFIAALYLDDEVQEDGRAHEHGIERSEVVSCDAAFGYTPFVSELLVDCSPLRTSRSHQAAFVSGHNLLATMCFRSNLVSNTHST